MKRKNITAYVLALAGLGLQGGAQAGSGNEGSEESLSPKKEIVVGEDESKGRDWSGLDAFILEGAREADWYAGKHNTIGYESFNGSDEEREYLALALSSLACPPCIGAHEELEELARKVDIRRIEVGALTGSPLVKNSPKEVRGINDYIKERTEYYPTLVLLRKENGRFVEVSDMPREDLGEITNVDWLKKQIDCKVYSQCEPKAVEFPALSREFGNFEVLYVPKRGDAWAVNLGLSLGLEPDYYPGAGFVFKGNLWENPIFRQFAVATNGKNFGNREVFGGLPENLIDEEKKEFEGYFLNEETKKFIKKFHGKFGKEGKYDEILGKKVIDVQEAGILSNAFLFIEYSANSAEEYNEIRRGQSALSESMLDGTIGRFNGTEEARRFFELWREDRRKVLSGEKRVGRDYSNVVYPENLTPEERIALEGDLSNRTKFFEEIEGLGKRFKYFPDGSKPEEFLEFVNTSGLVYVLRTKNGELNMNSPDESGEVRGSGSMAYAFVREVKGRKQMNERYAVVEIPQKIRWYGAFVPGVSLEDVLPFSWTGGETVFVMENGVPAGNSERGINYTVDEKPYKSFKGVFPEKE